MTVAEMSVGHAVKPMAGETEIWPTLAVARIGTIVGDAQGHEWTRHRLWWACSTTDPRSGERGACTARRVATGWMHHYSVIVWTTSSGRPGDPRGSRASLLP
jgi:hypothetical protein